MADLVDTDVCRECHRPAAEHHAFAPVAMPVGCVCDPGEWWEDVNPVCDGFVADADHECERCWHAEECHG